MNVLMTFDPFVVAVLVFYVMCMFCMHAYIVSVRVLEIAVVMAVSNSFEFPFSWSEI